MSVTLVNAQKFPGNTYFPILFVQNRIPEIKKFLPNFLKSRNYLKNGISDRYLQTSGLPIQMNFLNHILTYMIKGFFFRFTCLQIFINEQIEISLSHNGRYLPPVANRNNWSWSNLMGRNKIGYHWLC